MLPLACQTDGRTHLLVQMRVSVKKKSSEDGETERRESLAWKFLLREEIAEEIIDEWPSGNGPQLFTIAEPPRCRFVEVVTGGGG